MTSECRCSDFQDKCPDGHSIASGLAPPVTGENAFEHARAFAKGILLVSELEIKSTVTSVFERGLVVEPSGVAALAAVLTGKLAEKEPDLENKTVVAVVTGGNITPEELQSIVSS